MKLDHRARTVASFCLIGAGVVVAILGYLGVSAETEVAFQLPYLASAGVGALMLLGMGGVLLINTQLERDGERVAELEEAIRTLAAEMTRFADEMARPEGADRHPAGTHRATRAR